MQASNIRSLYGQQMGRGQRQGEDASAHRGESTSETEIKRHSDGSWSYPEHEATVVSIERDLKKLRVLAEEHGGAIAKLLQHEEGKAAPRSHRCYVEHVVSSEELVLQVGEHLNHHAALFMGKHGPVRGVIAAEDLAWKLKEAGQVTAANPSWQELDLEKSYLSFRDAPIVRSRNIVSLLASNPDGGVAIQQLWSHEAKEIASLDDLKQTTAPLIEATGSGAEMIATRAEAEATFPDSDTPAWRYDIVSADQHTLHQALQDLDEAAWESRHESAGYGGGLVLTVPLYHDGKHHFDLLVGPNQVAAALADQAKTTPLISHFITPYDEREEKL